MSAVSFIVSGNPNQAGGLVSTLFLCKGAKVLLTKNVVQQVGLCNGSTGTIVAFLYENDKVIPTKEDISLAMIQTKLDGYQFFWKQTNGSLKTLQI